jgi:hypothetical protein
VTICRVKVPKFVVNWLKFFLYLLKNKIILNFFIFVAAKKGGTTIFSPSFLLLLLDPGYGIWVP